MDENSLSKIDITNKLTIAGILLILSGIISIVLWANILSLDI
jgi:hypothetical protein